MRFKVKLEARLMITFGVFAMSTMAVGLLALYHLNRSTGGGPTVLDWLLASGLVGDARTQIFLACGGALMLAVVGSFWCRTFITRPITTISGQLLELANGNFDVKPSGLGRPDEIGQLAEVFLIFEQKLHERLAMEEAAKRRQTEAEAERRAAEGAVLTQERALVAGSLGKGLSALADGNLGYRMSDEIPAEYAQLRDDFNSAIAQLENTLSNILANSSAITAGTVEIAQASDDLSRRTETQAASLEETAAALDEITATVKKTATSASQASRAVGAARTEAVRSGGVVSGAVEAMSEIEQSSRQISQIIGVIDEIAFQTNLLALNAGVEAARAGDAGRGFAVVAQEVRALAQRSAEAAKEIKALISSSSKQVGQGVNLVGETGEALKAIIARVAEIDQLVTEIAASAQEQATGLTEVNTAVNQMDQVVQQNAAMVEQTTAATHQLKSDTDVLTDLISRFELGQSGPPSLPERAAPRAQPAPSPARAMRRQLVANFGGPAAVAADDWEEF
jgi:methyl-accepting chemotaxis protein